MKNIEEYSWWQRCNLACFQPCVCLRRSALHIPTLHSLGAKVPHHRVRRTYSNFLNRPEDDFYQPSLTDTLRTRCSRPVSEIQHPPSRVAVDLTIRHPCFGLRDDVVNREASDLKAGCSHFFDYSYEWSVLLIPHPKRCSVDRF